MPRKNKGIFSEGHSVARVKEVPPPRSQDSLTDVMRRTAMQNAYITPFAQSTFDQQFFQEAFLQCFNQRFYNNYANVDDYGYDYYDDGFEDDDDDDYDDEEDESCYHSASSSPLQPHPSLRALTQEEAKKHEKEALEREQRLNEKLDRKRQKKLRRKERKRLEKEQQEKKEKVSGVEQSQASGSQSENIIISDEESEQSDDEEGSLDPQDPEDLLRQAEGVRTARTPPTTGGADSPGPAPGKRRGRRKKKTKAAASREGSRPLRGWGASPLISQPPAPPEGPGADNEGNLDGSAAEHTRLSLELAAFGHRLASLEQYEKAVACFTDAIKCNSKEHKLFGNRSFCYERLQRFGPALQDADRALDLSPGWVKGLFRRGKALCGLKRYYDASLTYKNILQQDPSSEEAATELGRAQALHLMEMGFSWAESCEALREHSSLEEALEALFIGGAGPEEASRGETATPPAEEQQQQEQEEEKQEEEEQWESAGPKRRRPYQARRETRSESPRPTSTPRWEMFSVWVGSLAPTLTKPALHTLFSRAGNVTSVKMLEEQKCAFINYTRMEDCDRAIQLMDGLLVEGTSLAVRYPNRFLNDMKNQGPNPQPAHRNLKECFFWRTSGCTKPEGCNYKHVPEHKHIDRGKLGP